GFALENIDFDLRGGEIHCVMGENSAGKSTLMNILSGVETDYQGAIFLRNKFIEIKDVRDAWSHGICKIEQGLSVIPEMMVYENIFLGRELEWFFGIQRKGMMLQECQRALEQLGVDINPKATIHSLRFSERQL